MSKPAKPDPRIQQLKVVNRLLQAAKARDSMLDFCRLIMPDIADMDDATRTRFETTPVAKLLCDIMEKVEAGHIRRVAVSIGPQFGKALSVDTPIATLAGFVPIAALQPGDQVFDEQGLPCSVVAKTPVWRDRPVYRVHSDDGYSVLADAEHDWFVRVSRSYPVYERKTTKHLAEKDVLRNPLIMPSGALLLAEQDLLVAPYLLGAWLGDGDSDFGSITAIGEDGLFLEHEINREGYVTRRRMDKKTFCVPGLLDMLRKLKVMNNKHIPAEYLRASYSQRLALLQGLIDTDGFVAPEGTVEFCNTNERLAHQVRELVVSLGVKSRMYHGRATLYGKDCGPKFRVGFYMKDCARLPRKRERCRNVERCGGRYLTFSEPEIADTVCIEVDSPSHQFLCGEGMIATCNSQVISRVAPAWIAGRNPYRNMILGSYNQDFANEFGFEVRNIMTSPVYRQVFPEAELMRGGESKSLLVTRQGGKLAFVGVGGSGLGKPADGLVIDDPFRSADDADSQLYRDRVWKWFNGTVGSRTTDKTYIVIVHQRMHQDDLIGRLCDPDHPERNGLYKGIAKRWTYINLPAVIEDSKLAEVLGLTLREPKDPEVVEQFGTRPMTALWPGRKSLPLLAEMKQNDPQVFSALYMGRPAREEGEYFKKDNLVEYDRDELPDNLRKYGASDHAVSRLQRADQTVLGCVGVDRDDNIWVLPDLVIRRMQTDTTVEELLQQFRIHKPNLWWIESEMISKSFGPFLNTRMREERIYTTLDPISVSWKSGDLETRARSIQGRMSMGLVKFPKFAPWWQMAKTQTLNFPHAAHDDFVSWLSLIGMGLNKQIRPGAIKVKEKVLRVGSMEWILRASHEKSLQKKREDANAGW